jgi:YidC/Oxa1 family membrane protein insertase
MMVCWMMEMTLLTSQYRVRPAGNQRNMKVKMIGMNCITFCCIGSVMDPYFVLPLLMGASMYYQQKLNPPPPDPMQAKVMQFMPIIFTVFFLFFPAGLVLYWLVNNLLSISQQWVITRQIEREN